MASVVYSQARADFLRRLQEVLRVPDCVSSNYQATCERCGVEWEEGDEPFTGTVVSTPIRCRDCELDIMAEMLVT